MKREIYLKTHQINFRALDHGCGAEPVHSLHQVAVMDSNEHAHRNYQCFDRTLKLRPMEEEKMPLTLN